MWWHHPDATTYRDWLSYAGFIIDAEDYVPEGDDGTNSSGLAVWA